jgi:hypothetical protein
MWPEADSRQPKLFMALVSSLVLGLYAFYKGYLKPCKNIWFLLFLAYIPFNYFLTPKLGIKMFNVPVGTFWVFEAFLIILIFFLGHLAISSYKFTRKDIDTTLKVITYTGLLMSIYAILQFCGFDQFFQGRIGLFKSTFTCGTLGNPDILAPFLVLIVPIALYLRKYIAAIIIMLAVFFTHSQVAWIALAISLSFLIAIKSKKHAIITSSILIIIFSIISINLKSSLVKRFSSDGGRIKVWKQIVKDIRTPIEITKGKEEQFSLTGFGLGSFRYIFHSKYKDYSEPFLEAHNDYAELLFNTGIIGLALFLVGIVFLIRQSFPLIGYKIYLMASLISSLICAGGIFCWQNGAIIFYVIFITGLLINKEVVE